MRITDQPSRVPLELYQVRRGERLELHRDPRFADSVNKKGTRRGGTLRHTARKFCSCGADGPGVRRLDAQMTEDLARLREATASEHRSE